MKKILERTGTLPVLLFCLMYLSSCGSRTSENWLVEKMNLFPFKQNGLFGYVNDEGRVVIPFRYLEASTFRDGRAAVEYEDESGERLLGYIKEDGSFSSNGYLTATIYCGGHAIVSRKNEALSIVDVNGKVKATLDKAALYAWKEVEGKEDCVSLGIDVRPQRAAPFQCGVSLAHLADGTPCLIPIDYDGKLIRIPEDYEIPRNVSFMEGYCPLVNTNTRRMAIMDTKGRLLRNKNGGELINMDKVSRIKILTPSSKGFLFEQNGNWGMMNWEGDITINPQFDDMKKDGNLFIVSSGGRYGWCDEEGKFVINPQYGSVGEFCGAALAPVKMKDEDDYGYINRAGEQVITPQFRLAMPFEDELAIVLVGRRFGLINEKGNYVVNPQYEAIMPFQKSKVAIAAASENKCGLLDRSGKQVGGLVYEDTSRDFVCLNSFGYYTLPEDKFAKAVSDYYNPKEIADNIADMAARIPFGLDAKALMEQYDLKRNDFKYKNVKLLETSDGKFTYHLHAIADFYTRVSDGWFGYTNKFKEDAMPHSYEIRLKVYMYLKDEEERKINLRKALLGMFDEENKKLSAKGYQIRLSEEYDDRFIVLVEPLAE